MNRKPPAKLRGIVVFATLLVAGVPVVGLGGRLPGQSELEYAGSALLSNPRRAVLDGSVLYLAQVSGLQVYSMSDPCNPVKIWQQFISSGVKDIAVFGTHLYLDRGRSGLYIYDISNPEYPILKDSTELTGSGRRLLCSASNYLFRACDDQVQILGIGDPFSPTLVSTLQYPESESPVSYPMFGLAVSGNILLVGALDLLVIDISTISQPAVLSRVDVPQIAVDIGIKDDTLAVVSCLSDGQPPGVSTLSIYDFADPIHPALRGSLEKSGALNAVSLSGDFAFLAGGPTGVAAVDISDPYYPQLRWCLAPRGDAVSTVVYHGILLVVNKAPTLLDTSPYDRPMCDSTGTLSPHRAFAGDLLIYDILRPLEPVEVGVVRHPGYTSDLWIQGDLALVSDDTRGLAIVDISRPDTLIEVSMLPDLERTSAVAARGSFVFVFQQFYGLHVIDISDPSHPTVSTSIPISSGWVDEMTVSGDSLYIAAGSSGVLVVDVSSPHNPLLVATWPIADFAADVLVSDGYLYVADRNVGLQVIDLADPSTHTVIPEYPSVMRHNCLDI
ncbi:MAG: hypothetical protein AB1772_09870 [Candidatus Zixiibacteriota bacterium]